MRVERCHRRLLKPRANRTRESSSAPPRTIGALSGAANQFAAHTFTLTHAYAVPSTQHLRSRDALLSALHCICICICVRPLRVASQRSRISIQFIPFHSIPLHFTSVSLFSAILCYSPLLEARLFYSSTSASSREYSTQRSVHIGMYATCIVTV